VTVYFFFPRREALAATFFRDPLPAADFWVDRVLAADFLELFLPPKISSQLLEYAFP
jgi:hypothetical protein